MWRESSLKKGAVLKLDTIEDLVRRSQIKLARVELGKMLKDRVPRVDYPAVSALLVRCGQPFRAIKLLHPIVHPKGKRNFSGSAQEKAEYAAALTFIGANEEAKQLLKTIKATQYPRALLYDAFSKFSEWNYEEAIPNLRTYCSIPDLPLFDRTRGRVNLAAALVHGKNDASEANALLTDLQEIAEREQYHLLRAAIFELLAQNAFVCEKWAEAWSWLNEAEKLLGSTSSREALFVQKWKAIIRLAKPSSRQSAVKELQPVRVLATAMAHWETLRDCDRMQAVYCKDKTLLTHVYFGTPFEKFRAELLAQRVFPYSASEFYEWVLMKGPKMKSFDLMTSQIDAKPASHKLGGQLQRLFQLLASDFYRPWGIPSLFNGLFPGEWFNPVTSPPRTHRLIQRLRHWFEQVGLGLDIKATDGGYRLCAITPVSIRLPKEPMRENRLLHLLRQSFQTQSFTIVEAQAELDSSLRTAQRLLGESVKKGLLKRRGKGNSTVYVFPD